MSLNGKPPAAPAAAPAITLIKPRNTALPAGGVPPADAAQFALTRSGSIGALLGADMAKEQPLLNLSQLAEANQLAALGAGSESLLVQPQEAAGQSPGSKASTPTEEGDTEEDSGSQGGRGAGSARGSALAKRKAAAVRERAAQMQLMPSLAQEVAGLLGQDMPVQRTTIKRARAVDSDGYAVDAPPPRASRRARMHDDFNAASLIGSIFLRVQGTRAPAPLVHFDQDIRNPQWFKESIDGVQPVMSIDEFELEQVSLESMGKLVDGNVLPATLGEVAAYFSHVLGDPRTNKEVSPRVLIAIQCDRAKGWFTYKRDHDNSNFVPVVLCASENGRGLEEVSPAHFEVHRAQCAQKKWRQSFKVLGAQKLHKVTSLAQAALGDVLRHLERILGGADKAPMMLKPDMLPLQVGGTPLLDVSDVSGAIGLPLGLPMARTGSGLEGLGHRITGSSTGVGRVEGTTLHGAGVTRLPTANSPHRPVGMLPGARPAHTMAGARGMAGANKAVAAAVARRHTDDPSARPHADMARGLDLLATAASNAITSPRAGGAGTNVQVGLLAAALGGVSVGELLQLLVDNNNRKQQHAAQAQLLQQLAVIQHQAFATERQELAGSVAATANALGMKLAKRQGSATGDAAASGAAAANENGDKPASEEDGAAAKEDGAGAAEAGADGAVAAAAEKMVAAALSQPERDAIQTIMTGVRGADVSHAVRGILQHVAMQYVGEAPFNPSTMPALATALGQAAAAEGLLGENGLEAVPEEPMEGEEGGEAAAGQDTDKAMEAASEADKEVAAPVAGPAPVAPVLAPTVSPAPAAAPPAVPTENEVVDFMKLVSGLEQTLQQQQQQQQPLLGVQQLQQLQQQQQVMGAMGMDLDAVGLAPSAVAMAAAAVAAAAGGMLPPGPHHPTA